MENSKKILVNFNIGRGGRFNNPGHLKFCGVGNETKGFVEEKGFLSYENAQEIVEEHGDEAWGEMANFLGCYKESDIYNDFCAKYGDLGRPVLNSPSGNIIGEYVGDDEPYTYEVDGIYDTTYGILIESFDDLSEEEQNAVIGSRVSYELGYEIGIDFDNCFELRNSKGEVLGTASRADFLTDELEECQDECPEEDFIIYNTLLEQEF